MTTGSAAENVVLEINASRHAYNMSMEEVLVTVTQVKTFHSIINEYFFTLLFLVVVAVAD